MTDAVFDLCDALGPERVLHVANTATGLKGIVVVDNTAAGPAIGGTRMAPDVTLDECFRLARAMTLKNAAAGLPHGGAKSVIVADPAMPEERKAAVIRSFATAIADLADYVPGPDMGTDETAMAWIRDETSRAVGLPREVGGIPLDEIGATGFGLAVAAEVAAAHGGPALQGARLVVQGFGAVGRHAARFLTARGAVLVGASDSAGAVLHPAGLDVEALIAHKHGGVGVADFPGGDAHPRDAVLRTPCEILIPAARPDVITAENAPHLDCRLVLEGANIPATPEAEAILAERGILVVPDIIANAGGVICAAVEYQRGTETAAFATIEEKIARNTGSVLAAARRDAVLPRVAAEALAASRVRRAMALRRWS